MSESLKRFTQLMEGWEFRKLYIKKYIYVNKQTKTFQIIINFRKNLNYTEKSKLDICTAWLRLVPNSYNNGNPEQ